MNAQIRMLRALSDAYRREADAADGSAALSTLGLSVHLRAHARAHELAANGLEAEHRDFIANLRDRMNTSTLETKHGS
ncbi:hypothetical protein J2Y54_000562 [Sphingomonas sp. BE123]|uniref:hypothetical protein n=1 Tax=Sphingomonas sp. BE123 TaxID=2817842 RepID=UPI002857DAC9|nr:hypothetical protein [Sphingomonas sp. BE123]MDR6851069.1 hypothetical protein [Sphingomonas sp. BE123]